MTGCRSSRTLLDRETVRLQLPDLAVSGISGATYRRAGWSEVIDRDPRSRAGGTGEHSTRCPSMLRIDARLAEFIRSYENTGYRYIAQGLAVAMKSTQTAKGATPGEIAETTAVKAEWDAAEQALTDYQAKR